MHTISSDNVSHAWLEAVEYLIDAGGKAVHLAVAIERPADPEVDSVRGVLDDFVTQHRAGGDRIWPVTTVANTLFPSAFYRPGRENARDRLYELHAKAQRLQERMRDPENYFNRLVAYPTPDGEQFNQLEFIVDRLIKQRRPRKGGRGGALSSAYELGLGVPADGDLRIQAPGQDRNTMSFPCLSHVSLTLERDTLYLAALYRNQHFIDRAYGNYLGLARLAGFIANEAGVELGEIVCLATHADLQFGDYGKGRIQALASAARAAVDSPAAEVVSA
jgi:hypothetical protein